MQRFRANRSWLQFRDRTLQQCPRPRKITAVKNMSRQPDSTQRDVAAQCDRQLQKLRCCGRRAARVR
jgi:hypothetical protein